MIFTRNGRRFMVDAFGRVQMWIDTEPDGSRGMWVTGAIVDWHARYACSGMLGASDDWL
jgi:hypothetical protein